MPNQAPRPTFAEWLSATMDLWPLGIAWSRDPASNLTKLSGVIAQERQTRHERKLQLLDVEAVPTSSAELLPDWEQALGLPDPCRAVPGTRAERIAQLADVFFADHPPTPANMTAWALAAGWNITIREQRDFVAGVSMAGDAVGESDFTWVVTVLNQQQTFFIADRNFANDPLWTFPDLTTLQCVIRRAAPGHHRVFFILP
jgi:uncharacterized protein YmfQ (DUF2313 family)